MRVAAIQLDRILFNEFTWELDEHHLARQPAIIKPIGSQRWDVISVARIVDRNDNDVRAFLQQRSRLAVEMREAFLMFAERLLVQPNTRTVICRAKIE